MRLLLVVTFDWFNAPDCITAFSMNSFLPFLTIAICEHAICYYFFAVPA
ncbi:hypothetical protein FLA_3375 [Filimonas lacunae]|nr:hypothetical protein FLA_3375 [Filimonas lacunae]